MIKTCTLDTRERPGRPFDPPAMNHANYAAWRFMFWSEVKILTYRQIERLVARGFIRPRVSAAEWLAWRANRKKGAT